MRKGNHTWVSLNNKKNPLQTLIRNLEPKQT